MDSHNLIQSRRSFIFTPGLKPEMFPKAIKSGTDMVCVELEDGIAPQDKELARKLAINLFETKQNNDGIERILRINSLREKFGIDDKQDLLAMVAFDSLVAKMTTEDNVSEFDSASDDKISQLDSLITKALS